MESITVRVGESEIAGAARTFSTGSQGFYVFGPVLLEGVKYQVSCNVVRVGSKPSVGKPSVGDARNGQPVRTKAS